MSSTNLAKNTDHSFRWVTFHHSTASTDILDRIHQGFSIGLQNSQQPNALEMRPSGSDQSLKSELFFFWNENKNIRDKYIILIQTQD